MSTCLLKLTCAAVFLTIFSSNLSAQGINISTDLEDVRYSGRTYSTLKGSPFLYDDWVEGSVILTDGTEYRGLKINFDQLKEEVFFTLEGKTKAFVLPVRQFAVGSANTINQRIFRNGYSSIDGATENSFYEILYNGDASLLKRTSKAIVDERINGQTFKTKQIKATTRYYLAKEATLVKISRDKKTFLAGLPDQSKALQIQEYLVKNRINLKDDEGLIKVIKYYNTL